MPMYTYECPHCGAQAEHIVKYDERDNERCCAVEDCPGKLVRAGVERVVLGKPSYQMKAVMSDGTHVSGHFGKSAALRRKSR